MRYDSGMLRRGLVAIGTAAAVFAMAFFSAPVVFGSIIAANAPQMGKSVARGLRAFSTDLSETQWEVPNRAAKGSQPQYVILTVGKNARLSEPMSFNEAMAQRKPGDTLLVSDGFGYIAVKPLEPKHWTLPHNWWARDQIT